jgi:hypothetical protein
MDSRAIVRCAGSCLGALAVLSAVLAPAKAIDQETGRAHLAHVQQDETPGRDDTKVDGRRIKRGQLPATDFRFSLLLLPLAVVLALVLIAVGTMAVVHVRNSEDETWLKHLSERRHQRRQRMPPPPPPVRAPVSSGGRARIAAAWRILRPSANRPSGRTLKDSDGSERSFE